MVLQAVLMFKTKHGFSSRREYKGLYLVVNIDFEREIQDHIRNIKGFIWLIYDKNINNDAARKI